MKCLQSNLFHSKKSKKGAENNYIVTFLQILQVLGLNSLKLQYEVINYCSANYLGIEKPFSPHGNLKGKLTLKVYFFIIVIMGDIEPLVVDGVNKGPLVCKTCSRVLPIQLLAMKKKKF